MNEARTWHRIDIALAVVSAAVIVYGVLMLGWSVFIVIALFWLENVVIGVLNVAKMLISGARLGLVGGIAALAMAAFFTVHYGMFTIVHGVFVVMLFGQQELGGSLDGLFVPLGRMLDYLLADRDGWLAAVAITVLQVAAFLRWTAATRVRPVFLPELMFAPYGRIMILHITVLGGAFLIEMLKMPMLGAVLLVGLKLAFDLVSVKSAPAGGPAKTTSARQFIIAQEEDAARP